MSLTEQRKREIEAEVNKTPLPTWLKHYAKQVGVQPTGDTICNAMYDFAEQKATQFLDWCDIHSWCRPDILKDEWVQYFPSKNQYLPPITLKQLYHKFITEE